ncbi:2-methoxy-6-polyprenyl-1,4-benzoquinol methylase, mitochondrial [Elsinoe australis]|uniref:Protein PNG1 n=1 Tax=Elsinoe australis TaxID=40998 RepID=A0A2P7YE42_9PEZI|nr:2-methoxy-6-polyprenyl-1,4-benzoquinol methylase, mitochondrial [Elsinoe australis]
MADSRRVGQPRPGQQQRQQNTLPDSWPTDMTSQFRRVLSTRRMNALQHRPSSRAQSPAVHQMSGQRSQTSSPMPSRQFDQRYPAPASARRPVPGQSSTYPPQQSQPYSQSQSLPPPPPPSYSSLKNIPLIPTPPSDRKSLKFRTMLHSLSQTPCRWENPGLLDEALSVVPVQRIYEEAQEQADLFAAEAASLGPNVKPAWGYQDCCVIALMKWFRRDFFKWVNNPKCAHCNSATIAMGLVAPIDEEQARGATRVELYQCSHAHCKAFERFPRYNDAFVLLQTRRGRVGEWANCFTMLCRAMGCRVRWIWNSEDHVWTEVFSVHRQRWVHVDVCEEAWDKPLLYTQGWKRKLAYCIAFSRDGAMDVTRRYVRNPATQALPRDKAPEAVLLHIMDEIRALRRRNMEKREKFRLEGEDMREDREFRQFIIETLARDIARMLPGATNPDPNVIKAAEQRADAEWAALRTDQDQSNQRDPRQ